MKPLIEKLPLEHDHSFIARTFRTPHFEVPWHQHPEFELILFTEGEGNAFVGNHVGSFNTGDIYFLGSNLPHTFQKSGDEIITSAIVVQFLDSIWGPQFFSLPECRQISKFLETAAVGIKLRPALSEELRPLIIELEKAQGFTRILILLKLIATISESKRYDYLSTHEMANLHSKQQARIDKVFQYTIEHYADPIGLDNVASFAGMSVPAFCNYFRRCTKKTYIEFLNEVRIGKACQQLIDTPKPISSIAYESGYNTLTNFNKQFMKINRMQPGQYRKAFAGTSIVISAERTGEFECI